MESFTKSSPSFTRGAFDSIPAWQSHEKTGVFVDPKTGQPKDWDWAMAGYDAAVDFPTSLYWKDLMEFYPNAKVVLGVRTNAQQWVKSFRTLEGAARRLQLFDHIVGPLIRVLTLGFVRLPDFPGTVTMLHSNFFYGSPTHRTSLPVAPKDDSEVEARYNRHNAEVRACVPPERLLLFDPKDGWEPLCAFLGKPVPNVPFPHSNSGNSTLFALFWKHTIMFPRRLIKWNPYRR